MLIDDRHARNEPSLLRSRTFRSNISLAEIIRGQRDISGGSNACVHCAHSADRLKHRRSRKERIVGSQGRKLRSRQRRSRRHHRAQRGGQKHALKILSRITEPTNGRVEIRGRVASLLEVGTGFHGELTGRENIYLNGAIFGMTQIEIRNKFDEIVAFAEIEKFIDTPVKRYSSGMYVRLAFAVASHLNSDILLLDEVLAVGDAEFQKKCFNSMEAATKTGRTVILRQP